MNSSNSPDHVVVENLHLSYERWGQRVNALNGVSLTVPHNQWLIVVGHNGSGKSSLLRALSSDRVVPDQGRARINGKAVEEMTIKERAEAVFLIHQDPLLGTAAGLTIFENMAVADLESQVNNESRRAMQAKYTEMLRPFGLADRMRQSAETLSGGERQLLALFIARLRPSTSALVLLDEPVASLDPTNAERCLAEIADLRKAGKTIIQVTHDPELATKLGDRTVVMRSGKIVYDSGTHTRGIESLRNHWL